MIDETVVMETVERTMGHITGLGVSLGIELGDRLGLYRAMSGAGPMSADAVASATGCHSRLVAEWLAGQSAAGLVTHHPGPDRYELTDEAGMILADDASPVFLARSVQSMSSLARDLDRLEAAFTGDGAFAWGDHDQALYDGVEWFFRNGYRCNLAAEWIPALEGVEPVLRAGGTVCDVGCGHGAALAVMAAAHPASRFTGVDAHAGSVGVARSRLVEAGVVDRCQVVHADARSYEGSFDLITFCDTLHDLGDPVGAARHARERLTPGGSLMVIEPFALDDRADNIRDNPIAALMYHASSMMCTPHGLGEAGDRVLGAQAGPAAVAGVLAEAGFSRVERRAETPFAIVLQAHP